MKHWQEEKTGLRIELNKINFVSLFLFLSIEIFPQIPINGFCKLNSYQIASNYSRMFSLNFNNDSYSDLLIYSPSSKKISMIAGQRGETFSKEKFFDFPFHISNIIPIRERDNRIRIYVFASRKDLAVGICQFSSEGKPKVIHFVKTNSYPSSLRSADINNDGQQEILVAGPSFDGLSIFEIGIKKIVEKKIQTGTSYSEAIFTDLNNDQYPDIAAINRLNNTLDFFINNSRGEFKLTREIYLSQASSNLQSFDMNLDSYSDLIFTEGSKIKILYGDFSSSYSETNEIPTKYAPDELIIGDFNKDGRIDLSYLYLQASLVSLSIADTGNKFFEEIPIIQKEKLQSIIPFYSKFIDGLALISELGKIYTNTILFALSGNHNLSLSILPESINFFDANSDGVQDISFIDNFDMSMKLLVRNASGIPAYYYRIPLRERHKQFVSINVNKNSTSFFCYTLGKRLVEEINIDFSASAVQRQEFYSAKPINNFSVISYAPRRVAVASLHNNRLGLEIYEKNSHWFLQNDFTVSEKAVSSFLSAAGKPKLIFWTYDNDSLKLFIKTFLPEEEKVNMIAKVHLTHVNKVLMAAGDFLNLDKESIISFVESNQKQYILLCNDRFINSFDLDEIEKKLLINSQNQLYIGEIRKNGTKRLIVNNPLLQKLYYLNILRGGKQLKFSKLKPFITAKSFFVKNLTVSEYHLVFLNQEEECISIRRL